MTFEIREFLTTDYDGALSLWKQCEGVGLSDADSPCAIRRFLERNPGSSFVAVEGDRVVGTILCGQDGRRGFIYHLAVDPQLRRQSIGRKLAHAAMDFLQAAGIQKAHIMVYPSNTAGKAFWTSMGWQERHDVDLLYYSFHSHPDECTC